MSPNSERNPVSPPTVSGWYVVEFQDEFACDTDPIHRQCVMLDGWNSQWYEVGRREPTSFSDVRFVSWSGPLDLKAMLEKGGKE